ncbi:MAG: AFG1 family ATPase [Gammaproteobacteria bacterium]|nr:AFG1 family ATPase [Gammaproteobacteria bacterium]
MSPCFRDALDRSGYTLDTGQRKAVTALDRLARALTNPSPRSLFQRWRRMTKKPPRGLYLHGGVGRGKTFLMDLFFDCVAVEQKRRSHFHQFMQDTQDQLGALADRRDPLQLIAQRIAANTRVLCFDEFYVSDIGDAMILGTLLEGLFSHGVTLVATSNVAPTELYRDGLQRQRFVPAIELLQQHTRVMHIGDGDDYRLRLLESAEIFHTPADNEADRALARYFDEIAPDRGRSGIMLQIANRLVAARRAADGVAWFDFAEICTAPRSAADYLEIARLYHTVLVSGVPLLDDTRNDDARRFISLVDVLYDHRVKLILSAETELETIYRGERLAFEFERTRSRLREMQQTAYLGQAHIP